VHADVADFPPADHPPGMGIARRPSFGNAPEGIERFAFHTEFVEYRGTMRHDRVVEAINIANLGFTATRFYWGTGNFVHFARHMRRMEQPGNQGEPSHTNRYREQYRDHWRNQQPDPQPRQRGRSL